MNLQELVIAGLDPAIPTRWAPCHPKRDARVKPAHDDPKVLEVAMEKPEVPFPKHWLYYIAIKFVVLAGAVALVLRIYDVW
jgi:hypothetical protein